MASESILLPRRLGEKLRERAAETGWLPDELGVEFVRQGLNEELDNLAGDYYLANDVNCSGFDYAGDGKGFMPIGNLSANNFTGTFDGQGYKITRLYVNRASTNYVGDLVGCNHAAITNAEKLLYSFLL